MYLTLNKVSLIPYITKLLVYDNIINCRFSHDVTNFKLQNYWSFWLFWEFNFMLYKSKRPWSPHFLLIRAVEKYYSYKCSLRIGSCLGFVIDCAWISQPHFRWIHAVSDAAFYMTAKRAVTLVKRWFFLEIWLSEQLLYYSGTSI